MKERYTLAKPLKYDVTNHILKSFQKSRLRFIDGSDTPRAYLENCLETIDQFEPFVKAWVVVNIENARKSADESAKRYAKGDPLSRLDGLPIGIKDVLQTKDMPTSLGSPIFKNRETGVDSASVEALRSAGAIILGKTVTTEFAFMSPGPTTNPFDSARTPGGSSSGTSAAVGIGMIPAGLGNQVVGSIIRPASYCGNFAIKPTLGALHGGEGLSLSQLHLGVHAGSLEDMWTVTHEIAHRGGAEPGYKGLYGGQDISKSIKPKSLIVLETEGWDQCDADTLKAFEKILSQLSSCGIQLITRRDNVEINQFENCIESSIELCRIICSYEIRWALRNYRETGLLSQDLTIWLELAEKMTLEDYRLALQKRDDIRAWFANLGPLSDGIITLSSPGPAPLIDYLADSGESTYSFKTGSPSFNAATSLIGAPALTVPMMSVRSLPVGIQLIGQLNMDWNLTGYAAWLLDNIRPVSV